MYVFEFLVSNQLVSKYSSFCAVPWHIKLVSFFEEKKKKKANQNFNTILKNYIKAMVVQNRLQNGMEST